MAKDLKNMWWAIFKTGEFKDSQGKLFSADQETLDKIVEATRNFNYQDAEFPIVIGHPKDNSPMWGTIKKTDVKTDKNFLLAKPNSLVKEFVEWFDKKLYKNISLAIRPDLSIKHVAFLGAQPPAVTGLPAAYFKEEESDKVLEFGEFAQYEISRYYFSNLAQMLRGIKNYFIETKDVEYADKLLPEYAMNDLMNPPNIFPVDNSVRSYSESNNNKILTNTEDEMDKDAFEKLQTENKLLKDKAAALESEKLQLKADAREKEFLSFCESDEMNKKITPALLPIVVNLFQHLDGAGEFEFAEADEIKKNISSVDGFKKILAALPGAVEFGEYANKKNASEDNGNNNSGSEFSEFKNVDADALELHQAARKTELAEKITYREALQKAMAAK